MRKLFIGAGSAFAIAAFTLFLFAIWGDSSCLASEVRTLCGKQLGTGILLSVIAPFLVLTGLET